MLQTTGNQQWDELKPTLKSFTTESQRAQRQSEFNIGSLCDLCDSRGRSERVVNNYRSAEASYSDYDPSSDTDKDTERTSLFRNSMQKKSGRKQAPTRQSSSVTSQPEDESLKTQDPAEPDQIPGRSG